MRNLPARISDSIYEPAVSPRAISPKSKAKPSQASRPQRASDRVRAKIESAKRELERRPAAAAPIRAEAPNAATATAAAAAAVMVNTVNVAANAITLLTPAASRTKRAFDVIAAIALLIALSPVMLTLAFMVRRDGGPAIFGHRRIGSNGETFRCLKFRSMCVDAEQRLKEHLAANPEAQAEWDRDFKLRDDPRVTKLGDFLRRSSLDELPQLFNVIRGEMSLVGPRPIVADEVERYGDRFVAYRNCRPGITGLWQVSGRNDVSYRARVRLDSFYAARWSFAKDVFILVRTVGVVFRRSGAY